MAERNGQRNRKRDIRHEIRNAIAVIEGRVRLLLDEAEREDTTFVGASEISNLLGDACTQAEKVRDLLEEDLEIEDGAESARPAEDEDEG